jgi:hypothetical protein
MSTHIQSKSGYQRYHIETRPAPEATPWPNRFLVKVSKIGLAKLLIQEIFHQRGDLKAITSRPCMYGTFSGPVGGFAPRPQHCVGCLRCTTQHPEMVRILPNPERQKLGDSYFNFGHINAVAYEAETGSIPVKGAGYRGKFGGQGWDGMWTDMSEIVRPTRDGIHGREFISTVVDIGEKPGYLIFDEAGGINGANPRTISIPLPFLFDAPPASANSATLSEILASAAQRTQTLSIQSINQILLIANHSSALVPLIRPGEEGLLAKLGFSPQLIMIDGMHGPLIGLQALSSQLQSKFPEAMIGLRLPYNRVDALVDLYHKGLRIFHLVADLHGQTPDGRFVIELIRAAHLAFVEAGVRDEITLIGSGGIVAAEHVPKAIICGLDAVALDTPLLAALQVHFDGECRDRQTAQFKLPAELTIPWGTQRLMNLSAAWRDQLLEILGAMGLREVRRLRGEMGRAMFQVDLEREAFAGIDGYA